MALKGELEEALASKSAPEWQALLNQAGVPAGCVLSVPGALDQPQVRDRGMIATFRDVAGVERDVQVVRTGFKINGHPPRVENPPPTLGQHTAEVLKEMGLGDNEIDILHAEGAI
jgi:formyl-CoA transferase